MLGHVPEVVLHEADVGRNLGQQGILVEVVLDQLRHEGVDGLVVRHAGARRVGQRDVARPIGVDQPGNTEEAVAPEGQRVEELVVHPPVDHVHALAAARRAHEDVVVLDDEVRALHEQDAHLPRQERVLEVGRVVNARRQGHRDRALAGPRGHEAQRLEQERRVVVDRANRIGGEQLGEHPAEQLPVLEDVRDAARHPAVVLEHEVLAPIVPDDVGADHVGEDLPGRDDAEEGTLELLAGQDELGRDHPIAEAVLRLVDVQQEQVERGDALDQAVLDDLPLGGGDDARHEVEREDALEAFLLAGDGEGDALADQGQRLEPLAPVDLGPGEGLDAADERPVVRAGSAVGREDLAEALVGGDPPHRRRPKDSRYREATQGRAPPRGEPVRAGRRDPATRRSFAAR